MIILFFLVGCITVFPYDIEFPEDPTRDYDGDGFSEDQGDCNDQDDSVYLGAAENEETLCASDKDGDGWAGTEYGGQDCDDTTALATPNGTEVCGDDIDNDCN